MKILLNLRTPCFTCSSAWFLCCSALAYIEVLHSVTVAFNFSFSSSVKNASKTRKSGRDAELSSSLSISPSNQCLYESKWITILRTLSLYDFSSLNEVNIYAKNSRIFSSLGLIADKRLIPSNPLASSIQSCAAFFICSLSHLNKLYKRSSNFFLIVSNIVFLVVIVKLYCPYAPFPVLKPIIL